MSEPIVFISHFGVEPGDVAALQELHRSIAAELEAEKPRTLAFASYLGEESGRLTIVHVFADADAMATHFEGSDERSRRAYELMRPVGWEIYGNPHPGILDQMRQAAAEAGVELELGPDYLGGFLRLAG